MNGAENPAGAGEPAPESLRGRVPELLFAVGGMVATAALVALVPDLRHAFSLALHGDLRGLHEQFRHLGAGGVLLLLALILAHAVLLYPTEIVTATAGFVYGFLPGLALVTAGWLASALLAYLLGRVLGRAFLHRVFGSMRFASLERAVVRGGVSLLLAVRLIPVMPFSLTGYVAGAVRVPLWRFSWTTLLGYLPLTALVAYLGSQARSLSIGDPRVWIGAGVMIALLAAARFVSFER
ncbi:MAG: VTT domain-containing protein [Solirubrobacterales bacterium]|nr:VTT domain-containing protein [Solirubrobacterales bacterium]